MESLIASRLDAPFYPMSALRLALRLYAREEAEYLARTQPRSPGRIEFRLSLIEALEACKTVDEYFWRDVVADVRYTMEREGRS